MKRVLLFIFFTAISAGATVQCGKTSIGVSTSPLHNFLVAEQTCTPPSNSTIIDCVQYVGGGGGTQFTSCAVYDSDGSTFSGCSGNCPGTLLCQNPIGTVVPGSPAWTTISMTTQCSGVTLTGGHIYWIAQNSSISDINSFYDTTAQPQAFYYSKTFGTYDSTFNGAGASNATITFSAYLDISASVSGGQVGAFAVGP